MLDDLRQCLFLVDMSWNSCGILSWKVKQIGILFFLKHLVYSLQVQPVVQYDVILCSMDIFVSIGSI